jgi:hypothetical protein
MDFSVVREVVEEFLVTHNRIVVRDIQRTNLGQALVRFAHLRDTDNLIYGSTHAYEDVYFSILRHNEGRNLKTVLYNKEAWIMLLGFPLNFVSYEQLEQSISTFGHLIKWKFDQRIMSRILLHIWVVDLSLVPQFIVISECKGFQGRSWTMQGEVIHHCMLGQIPQYEYLVP